MKNHKTIFNLKFLITVIIFASIYIILFPGRVFATTETFTTSGNTTWVAPAGVTSVQVEVWGAGGNGTVHSFTPAVGGGGGKYSKKNSVSVTPGNSYTVHVGAHGTTGGGSYFIDTSTVSASGGGCFIACSNVGDTTHTGGNGGTESGCSTAAPGGGGGAGASGNGGNGGNTTSDPPACNAGTGGSGGSGGGGAGGAGGETGANGSNGAQPGGGGGGAPSGHTAGVGGDGEVILTYTAVVGPTQAVFTNSTRTLTAGACNGAGSVFTLQLQDSGGTPTNPTSSTVINVSSNSTGTVTIYSDSSCTTTVSGGNFTFTTSDNTKSVYMVDTKSSSPTWTLTAHQTSGSDTISDGTQSYTVNPGSLDHYSVSVATPQTAGVCFTGTKTVTAKDANENTVTTDSSTVDMTSSGSGVTFYTSSSCSSSTTQYTLSSGTSSIFLKTNKKQSFTVTATKHLSTETGTSSSITVNAGSVSRLVVTLPGQTFTDGSGNSGSVTGQTAGASFTISKISATDDYFNVNTAYSGSKTLAYSGPANAPNSQAPSYTTSVSFTSGQSTTTLNTTLYKAESPTITVTESSNYGYASSSVTVSSGSISADVSDSTVTGSETSQINTPLTVTVTLYDTWENPKSAVTASHITLVSSGGSFTQPSSNTDSNGQTSGTVQWASIGSKTVQVQIATDTLVQNDGTTADADGYLDNTLAVTVQAAASSERVKGNIRFKGNVRLK